MMASTCKRVIGRTFLSSLKSTVKPRLRPSTTSFPSSTSSTRPSTRRFSPFTSCMYFDLGRNSVSELGGVQSLMPLHSAMATARMTSCLSLDGSSRALSQELGLSVPR
ncbi:uncharacterized protein LOC142614955 isoform X1 [Castanea sativa]|uniref:uncharacterized protein LOC142614955 isoform X1 n=1 Tax=Castanea sativa TaxID=21020 RepID=UPI003ADF28EF